MGLRAWHWIAGMLVLTAGFMDAHQSQQIPRTWDDEEIARHEVPLAQPEASPKHVSSDYYYRIPVRPIYKSYPGALRVLRISQAARAGRCLG